MNFFFNPFTERKVPKQTDVKSKRDFLIYVGLLCLIGVLCLIATALCCYLKNKKDNAIQDSKKPSKHHIKQGPREHHSSLKRPPIYEYEYAYY